MLATLAMGAVFFGDLHIHTALSSDAVGDPNQLFNVARYEAELDFAALTDHDTTMTDGEWDQTRALAAAANAPGEFVAFSGIEWTKAVHIAVYFLEDDEPFCRGCNTVPSFEAFYGDVLREHRGGAHIAHPNNQDSFASVDDELLTNVELMNARSSAFDQEYGPKGALHLLGRDYQLGFVGVSDEHSYDGTGEAARHIGWSITGCHATSLTRAGILEALRNRRCWATNRLRTVVDMTAAGAVMGESTEVCLGDTVDVDLTVGGTTTPSLVEIVQDGVVIASRSDCTSPDCDLSTSVPVDQVFTNIYGRVHHAPSTGCWMCKTYASPVKIFTATSGPSCATSGPPAVPSSDLAGTLLLVGGIVCGSLGALEMRRRA